MENTDTLDKIWVSPVANGDELGTSEHPYTSLKRAFARVRPGQTVVLKDGEYGGDCTIQQSGTALQPVRITAENKGGAVVVGGCWYLYDVSDILITDIVFRDAPSGALSVMGACCRNGFSNLQFRNCSRVKRPACTVFFGGSGAQCNVMQGCEFRQDDPETADKLDAKSASVAVMLSEGDTDGGAANADFILRRNSFVNYGYGVMVGVQDKTIGHYGHVVEYNTFEECGGDALMIKCGDTTARSNQVVRAGGSGIAVLAGSSSTIIDNRISQCGNGIRVCGNAHTVARNCVARCRSQGVHVASDFRPYLAAGTAILIESNTIVDCGKGGSEGVSGILNDPGTSCVVEKNLFAGQGKPYLVDESGSTSPRDEFADLPSFFSDNAVVNGSDTAPGCSVVDITFAHRGNGDYTNDSAYGASGWVLTPGAPPDPSSEDETTREDYRLGLAEGADGVDNTSNDIRKLVEELDTENPFGATFFFPDSGGD